MTVPSLSPSPFAPRAGRLLPRPGHRAASHHRDLLHRARARRWAAPGSTPTPSEEAALADVLRLSRGMAYKNAWPASTTAAARRSSSATRRPTRREALLRAYGRFVECLGGRYVTACDVGTYVADMDVVARERPASRPAAAEANGGAGDSSVLTAFGVFQGMRAGAAAPVGRARRWPGRTRRHRRRRQGRPAARRAPARGRRRRRGHRRQRAGASTAVAGGPPAGATSVADTEALVAADLDVYAPCALGGALDDATVAAPAGRRSSAAAANNQLADRGARAAPPTGSARGILYAPDYLVNAGGVIQVADELHGFDFERARAGRAAIFDTTARGARARGRRGASPRRSAADRLAEAADGRVGRRRDLADRPALSRPRRPTVPDAGRCDRRTRATGMYRCAHDEHTIHGTVRESSRRHGADCEPPRHYEGVDAMGRGRAKAKQTKVARELKYSARTRT